MATNMANYVRFTRGTPTAYANLQKKDPDTLYFISEKDAETGILYLGTKIIAGGSSSVSVTSLKDLTDVLIGNDIQPNSLLMYDEEQKKWIGKTIQEIFDVIVPVMVGATETTPGLAGLVPTPQAGAHEFVLLGDGTWSSGLKDLTATVATIVGSVAGDDKLSARQIAESVFETYVGDLEGFKELAEFLKDNPNVTDFNGRLQTIESTLFDTGSEETGDFKAGLQTIVGSLQISMEEVTQEITNIYERLTWQELGLDDED